jgi:NAD dependent epimerase/dehydratase family enzyme
VAALVRLVDDEGARGPFNLTAPEPLTNAEFGRVLGRVIGRPSMLPTPALALRLAFGEMATVLLDGQRAIPKHLLDRGFSFRYPDAESALRSLLL